MHVVCICVCFVCCVKGGTLLVGDHVGSLELFAQLQCAARVGYEHIDVAWRQQDMFVWGAARPMVGKATGESSYTSTITLHHS